MFKVRAEGSLHHQNKNFWHVKKWEGKNPASKTSLDWNENENEYCAKEMERYAA